MLVCMKCRRILFSSIHIPSWHSSIMKRMNFFPSKFLIGVVCLFSIVSGFVAFNNFSYRFGPRPIEWRVIGADLALQHAIEQCFRGNDADRTKFMICAQKKLLADMPKWGTRTFMQALTRRLDAQTTGRNFTQCHDLAHAIGWAGTMTSRRVQITLPQCTNACVSGCQHGAVSAWYGMGNDLKSTITTLCIDGVDWAGNREAQGGCFHEVGHAVADVSAYNLVESLKLCDQIIPEGRIGCAAGVFMEMYEAATFAQAPQQIPNNNPMWCGALWSPYDAYCYDRAGSYEYSRAQDNQKSFSVCRQVPELYRETCVSGIGQNIFYVYQHKEEYLQEIQAFCKLAEPDMYFACIAGLIRSSVFVEPNVKTGIQLCQSLDVSEQLRCFSIIGGVLEERKTKNEKNQICEQVSVLYRNACLDGKTLKY